MRLNKGFTLIELMIVVGIVAILAAIAIPAYQNYVIRAKITEGLNIASSVKLAVAETMQAAGSFPETNAAAGLPVTVSGGSVTGVTVGTSGVITIAYDASVIGITDGENTLVLTPTDANNSIAWACTGTVLNKYKPSACRT